MKKDDFIGVWKLIEYGDGKINTSQTHLVVKEDILWEVWPDSVYYENNPGPEVRYKFEEGEPAKLSLDSGFKFLVKKERGALFVKLGSVFGNFPESFEDDGNLGKYIPEEEDISQVIGVLPKKLKQEEFKISGVGTIRYNANLNWWEGEVIFQEEQIMLYISIEENLRSESLYIAKQRLEELKKLPIVQIASDKLLSLHNESWNDNKEELTHDMFKDRIKLESIILEPDKHSEIVLKSSDLFLGHSIHILLDESNMVLDVEIMG